MNTWQAGRQMLASCSRERALPLDAFLESLARHAPHRVRGTGLVVLQSLREDPQATIEPNR